MTGSVRGAVFMCLAMLGFGIEDALFKAATQHASPGMATLVFGLVALALSILWARYSGIPAWSAEYLRRRLLIRTAFELVGRLFFALSLAFVPLATTSAILQAAPLMVTLGAALVLGEKVGPRRWAATGAGFIGVLLILRPGAEGFQPTVIFAVLGMIGFAGRDLATRTSPPGVHAAQLGVLGFAVVTAAGIVILLAEGARPTMPPAPAWPWMIGTALVGVVAYAALTQAMRSGTVSVVAPFRYFRLIVALVIAYAAFGERPDGWMLAGAALIVVSGLYTLLRDTRARRAAGAGAGP
ncbi:DMT family transporter [Citreimonas salinaria]|uniref:EamA-like transporter family protein n=1 Tax=Citreimonas salinaria TaxID=321339 RepID=A0A1H3F1Y2_9RHOB|nr:DMT family transporter [Citreimonas salinaria]SDX84880.1 EamA-like transporter family protein [Citreimonas salinaria]